MLPNYRKMISLMDRVRKLSLALRCYILANPVIVDQNTANIRARLCASCHNNVDESKALAGCILGRDQERKAVVQMREAVKGQTTQQDPQLLFCDIDGSDNKLSIWLFNAFLLNREDRNSFPCFCWKKELQ